MPKLKQTYHDRFIQAVRYWMADNDISEIKQVAEILKMPYINLYKVMQKVNKPSVELCAMVCEKGSFSAEWLFLGKGDIYKKYADLAQEISAIFNERKKEQGYLK